VAARIGAFTNRTEEAAMRHSAIAVTATVLACACAAVPAAAAPERVTGTLVQAEPVPAFPCADGSEILQTYTLERAVTTFTDDAGTVLRRVRQVRIQGVLLSADGTRSLPYDARFRRAEDFVAGTNTLTGRITVAGDAGRIGREVRDLETGEILQSGGRSIEEFEARVCEALA
jgi:hypothetical protein